MADNGQKTEQEALIEKLLEKVDDLENNVHELEEEARK